MANNSSEIGPSLWDKIEIGYSFAAAGIGLPLNFLIFAKLVRQIVDRKHNRLTLLSLQINIADIMILVVKCIAYSIWMIVQAWYIGDIGCKIYQYLLMLPFYLSSNSRVSLALDMYQSIHFPMSIRITGNRYARIYILVSWFVSLVCSLPQVYFFQATQVPNGDHWQCYNKMVLESQWWLNAYDLYHVLVVFWIPLVCIVILYASITREGFKAMNSQKRMKTGCDDEPVNAKRLCAFCLPKKLANSEGSQGDAVAMPLLVQQTSKFFAAADAAKDDSQELTVKLQREVQRRSKSDSLAKEAQHRARIQKLKILKFSLSIIAAYVACWLPYQVKALFDLQSTHEERVYRDKYWHWLTAVMIFNSCLNPILYGFGQTKAGGRTHAKRDSSVPTIGQASGPYP